jgi:predicted nucleotidyltransferase
MAVEAGHERLRTVEQLERVLRGIALRLERDPGTDALMLTGSTATRRADDSSDLDLLVAVGPELAPVAQIAAHVGEIDIDVVVAASHDIERLADERTLAPYWSGGGLPRMLREGHVLFDKSGAMTRAKAVSADLDDAPPDAFQVGNARFSATYDLDKARRLLASSDPQRRLAGELRVMQCVGLALHQYFVARELVWRGVRSAIATLSTTDPGFLEELEACVAAPEGATRLRRYEQVAAHALAPDAPSWQQVPGALVRIGACEPSESIEQLVARWVALVKEPA